MPNPFERQEKIEVGKMLFHLEEQEIKPNTVRLSIGTKDIDDIIKDLESGFAAVEN